MQAHWSMRLLGAAGRDSCCLKLDLRWSWALLERIFSVLLAYSITGFISPLFWDKAWNFETSLMVYTVGLALRKLRLENDEFKWYLSVYEKMSHGSLKEYYNCWSNSRWSICKRLHMPRSDDPTMKNAVWIETGQQPRETGEWVHVWQRGARDAEKGWSQILWTLPTLATSLLWIDPYFQSFWGLNEAQVRSLALGRDFM